MGITYNDIYLQYISTDIDSYGNRIIGYRSKDWEDYCFMLDFFDWLGRKKLNEIKYKKYAGACLRWFKSCSATILSLERVKSIIEANREEFERLRSIADEQVDEIKSGCSTGFFI